jgi:hypothetical protein
MTRWLARQRALFTPRGHVDEFNPRGQREDHYTLPSRRRTIADDNGHVGEIRFKSCNFH